MAEELNFLDELLLEVEAKEMEKTEAYYDLLLLDIKRMNEIIEHNFNEAEKEIELIKSWTLKKNTVLEERKRFIEMKLEGFIKERGEKTISLPNGELKYHKKPDKVEITDIDLFLKSASKDLLTIISETVKPNLMNIKKWIKTKPVPAGVIVEKGKEEFSYVINNQKEEENGRQEKTGNIGVESASDDGAQIRRSA